MRARDVRSAGPHYKLPAEKVKAVGRAKVLVIPSSGRAGVPGFDEFVIPVTIMFVGQRGVADHGVVNMLGGLPALAHRLSLVLNQRDL